MIKVGIEISMQNMKVYNAKIEKLTGQIKSYRSQLLKYMKEIIQYYLELK